QPSNLFAFMFLEERLGFRAGKKHEHEQAQVVEKIERGFFLGRGPIELKKVRIRGPSSKHKRPQNTASQNLSNHAWLPQPRKQVAEQMRSGKQDRDKQNEWADSAGRHKSGT